MHTTDNFYNQLLCKEVEQTEISKKELKKEKGTWTIGKDWHLGVYPHRPRESNIRSLNTPYISVTIGTAKHGNARLKIKVY